VLGKMHVYGMLKKSEWNSCGHTIPSDLWSGAALS
jgi:hypothetical protein